MSLLVGMTSAAGSLTCDFPLLLYHTVHTVSHSLLQTFLKSPAMQSVKGLVIGHGWRCQHSL